MKKKVLLGMSGGIDSTAAAVLLIEQGYDVTGLTFQIDKVTNDANKKALKICNRLNINHITLNITKEFNKSVILKFINDYEKGITPNPCINCNKAIKFGMIYDYAIKNGYDYVSTGHYAIILKIKDRFYLQSSLDIKKDQTYFLHVLLEEQLKHILFPLGKLSKEQARDICAKNKLLPRESKESQEICFIKDDYKIFLKRNNAKNKMGNFIYEDGTIIKPHDGIVNYTIGQRKGMNLAIGKPAYVKNIDYKSGDVVITSEKNLYGIKAIITNITLINGVVPKNEQIYAKIRYSAKKASVTIHQEQDKMIVVFSESQRAITLGQSIVFYTKKYVVGGGIIEKGEQ
ncbi:MAG: tRNA 2-thiouridine(34) synthase MnmA [Clostridiales bacterium]|nr:tRNA 2-thiouridine(34) synthase MnmA [Clostridiales bacterium]